MRFTKMEGLGNDYIYVNLFEEEVPNQEKLSIALSDRHFAIGSDGLILIAPSEVADVRMIMYNADGSESEMCGNGVRCVGKYAHDHGLAKGDRVTVETGAGIKILDLREEQGTTMVTVDMGEPILAASKVPVNYDGISPEETVVDAPLSVGDTTYRTTCVSMGNPHCITFVNDTATFDLENVGPKVEHHPNFPNRINAEFIQILNRKEVNMRVWERGSGETLACGTGACASTVACILNDKTDREITLHLLGGDLKVAWKEEDNHVYMTGPAVTVYEGEIDIQKYL